MCVCVCVFFESVANNGQYSQLQGQLLSPKSSTIRCSACSCMLDVLISFLKRLSDCVSLLQNVVFSIYTRQFNLNVFGPLYFNQENPISSQK